MSDAEPEIVEVVGAIHAAPGKVSIVVTGAGTSALAWLFGEAGASRTVLNARIPYSSAALNEFTGKVAKQHVSADEANLMARSALEEAERLGGEDDELLAGVACTAAIATDRVRRGENRCHVALAASDGRAAVMSLELSKGERDRAGEEDIVSRMVLNAVAEAKRVEPRLQIPLLADEKIERIDSSTTDGTASG